MRTTKFRVMLCIGIDGDLAVGYRCCTTSVAPLAAWRGLGGKAGTEVARSPVAEARRGGAGGERERARVSYGDFCCGVERRTDLDGHRRCFYPFFRSRNHRQSPKGAVPRHLGKPFARERDQLTFSLSCSAHSSASAPLSGALITPLRRIYCRDPTSSPQTTHSIANIQSAIQIANLQQIDHCVEYTSRFRSRAYHLLRI